MGTKRLNPYIIFCMETRPKVVEQNPKMSFAKVAKKVAKLWKELSEDQKKIYIEKAEKQNENA